MFVESNVRFQSIELLSKALKLYKRVGFGAVIITFDHTNFFSIIASSKSEHGQHQLNRPRGRKATPPPQEQQENLEPKNNCEEQYHNNNNKQDLEQQTQPTEQNINKTENNINNTENNINNTENINKTENNFNNTETNTNNTESKDNKTADDEEFDSKYDKAYEQARRGLFGIEGLLKKYSFSLPDQILTIPMFQQIQSLCKAENIPFAIRVNVDSNNQEILKKELAKLDKFDVLVSVTTTDKDCLVLASKDSRVDIVSFITPQQIEAAFKGAISQCYHSEKTIEIGFEPLILEKHANRAKMMRTYQKFFNLCRFPRDRIIATNESAQWVGIRGPKELMAVIMVCFHIAEPHAKRLLREHQEMILSRYYLLLGHQLGEMDVKIHEGFPELEEYDTQAQETLLNLKKNADLARNKMKNHEEAQNK